ncbi:MAG: serine protein kinase RIO [Nitrososphaeria archaeon]|nr:serine protein kinase RIO [Nitrososphaeria archaeon]
MEEEFFTEKELRRLFRLTTHGKKRMLVERDREEEEVFEEVFDKRTMMTLYEIVKRKVIYRLDGAIGSGKESKIFHGVDYSGNEIAVKIFLTTTAEFRKRLPYIIGDRRFEEGKKGGYLLIKLWARKEYVNLEAAYNSGVNVPKPIMVLNNVLVMEFIGKDGKRAPLLSEVEPKKTDYLKVVRMIRKLYSRAKLVHADLSEHNIFKWGSKIYFFDFGSAVESGHPNALEFLYRDIRNVNRFFLKHGIEVWNEERILKGVI